MSLHRLTHIEIGVPNVAQTADYYQEFGLSRGADGAFSTTDGGEQLRVSHAAARRLVELGVGVDDETTSPASPPLWPAPGSPPTGPIPGP